MGTGPPPGGPVPAVWERVGLETKVTSAGTTVFGARTSAGGRPLWDRRAKAVGISLWGSPRWLQFREMAGDGGRSRGSGTERPAPMTSTVNWRPWPSDPSWSGSRSREGSSRAAWASNEGAGALPAGWMASVLVIFVDVNRRLPGDRMQSRMLDELSCERTVAQPKGPHFRPRVPGERPGRWAHRRHLSQTMGPPPSRGQWAHRH